MDARLCIYICMHLSVCVFVCGVCVCVCVVCVCVLCVCVRVVCVWVFFVCVLCVYVGGRSSPAYARALNFVVGFFVMHLLIPFKVHMSRTR